MYEFDEALQLRSHKPHEWIGRADPRREATVGMFGGWTAALLLRAVLNDAIDQGSPSTLTVHFVKAIPAGSHVAVRTRNVGGSRSLSTWQSEIEIEGTDGAAAIATVVLAKHRESHGFTDMAMPSVPAPEGLPEFDPPGKWGKCNTYRAGYGFPPFDRPDTRSLCWVRDHSGRPLDHLQLAYQADNFPPRNWFMRPEPGPYSTMSMSVYFYASKQELADLLDDYVLLEAAGTRAESSTVGVRANIWSRGGQLLATAEQMGWFR